ncbi:unnamed protein product [Closterium sp. NIES-53]
MHVSNGFATALSPEQVWRLERHPAVAAVTRSRRVTPLTTDSPTFLGMCAPGSLWPANGGQAKAGDGMVIGVVDTGIWPEHPSFSDAWFPSSKPAGWSGKCDTTSEFKCNNKLIGGCVFYKGFKMAIGDPDFGNKDVPMAGSKASRMAPAARLAMYKVLWYSEGFLTGTWADIEAAVNQAVADGVDVISILLGGMDNMETYFDHMTYLSANLVRLLQNCVCLHASSTPAVTSRSHFVCAPPSPFLPFLLLAGPGRGVCVICSGKCWLARLLGSLLLPHNRQLLALLSHRGG